MTPSVFIAVGIPDGVTPERRGLAAKAVRTLTVGGVPLYDALSRDAKPGTHGQPILDRAAEAFGQRILDTSAAGRMCDFLAACLGVTEADDPNARGIVRDVPALEELVGVEGAARIAQGVRKAEAASRARKRGGPRRQAIGAAVLFGHVLETALRLAGEDADSAARQVSDFALAHAKALGLGPWIVDENRIPHAGGNDVLPLWSETAPSPFIVCPRSQRVAERMQGLVAKGESPSRAYALAESGTARVPKALPKPEPAPAKAPVERRLWRVEWRDAMRFGKASACMAFKQFKHLELAEASVAEAAGWPVDWASNQHLPRRGRGRPRKAESTQAKARRGKRGRPRKEHDQSHEPIPPAAPTRPKLTPGEVQEHLRRLRDHKAETAALEEKRRNEERFDLEELTRAIDARKREMGDEWDMPWEKRRLLLEDTGSGGPTEPRL